MSAPKPHLELHLRHRVGALDLTIDLELTHPWTVLFGPSGSGKTTILRTIAGLIRPDHSATAQSSVILRRADNAEPQIATDTAAKIFVAPHLRWVRWSAQTPALFPNLTVSENLQLALSTLAIEAHTAQTKRAAERSIDEPRSIAAPPSLQEAIERFRLRPLSSLYPASLSGGERQRVAVARAAIAANGRLLMLDEPFSGLDARLRDDLIDDLRSLLQLTGTPVLSVTHDLGEAFQLADEVIQIADGRVSARGTAEVVLAAERTRLLTRLGARS